MTEDYEEMLEMEMDEPDNIPNSDERKAFKRYYFEKLISLQSELVELQEWTRKNKKRVVILFEGRDAAGKGGVIKRIMQRTDPKVFKPVALPIPTTKEKSQWYFQRYIRHLPSGGHITIFDRSWYNRPGVEKIMGFCTQKQVDHFYTQVQDFENLLIDDGIILLKYWLDISKEEQEFRFINREHTFVKNWKFSPVDKKALAKYDEYTRQQKEIFNTTGTEKAPWHYIGIDDKKRARLLCLQHILATVKVKDKGGEVNLSEQYVLVDEISK